MLTITERVLSTLFEEEFWRMQCMVNFTAWITELLLTRDNRQIHASFLDAEPVRTFIVSDRLMRRWVNVCCCIWAPDDVYPLHVADVFCTTYVQRSAYVGKTHRRCFYYKSKDKFQVTRFANDRTNSKALTLTITNGPRVRGCIRFLDNILSVLRYKNDIITKNYLHIKFHPETASRLTKRIVRVRKHDCCNPHSLIDNQIVITDAISNI